MKRWKTFWRNRKQSDRVKIMLYLGIAAAVFLVLTVVNIVRLVRYINTPAEYILSCYNISDAGLKQLAEVDGVDAVTLSRTDSLTVKYKAKETMIEVAGISREYAQNVYGAERTGEMMTLFASSKAYELILAELCGGRDSNEEIITEVRDGDRYRACRIVCIDREIGEAAFVFTIIPDSALKKQADTVRTFVPKQDTEQTVVSSMRNMGYTVVNGEDILGFQSSIDRLFLEMKYQLLIAVMCGLWIATLRRFAADKRQ